ncbi:MAG TPA: benzoate 1,2-dioxygenase large subunit, partial [Gordonia polyisoprenivorans]|nr:benzoate 1,2-dioxygenase large subunit [Gordonia polyisoprenivorans]
MTVTDRPDHSTPEAYSSVVPAAPSEHVRSVLSEAVIDDRDAGIYRANRRIFTDEEIF